MRLPASAFWRSGVAACSPSEMDGIFHPKVAIGPSEAIATAGSCFAQHIGHHLQQVDCELIDAEPAPRLLPAHRHGDYGFSMYSARYGNIFTAHRLLQLATEASGAWTPHDIRWERGGRFYDALRPMVEPNGLDSPDEVARHRAQHLEKVREVFRRMDVFVFTLGLTEAWRSRQHGTVYTIAPGVRSGTFDPERYEFVNFGFAEIESAFVEFVEALRAIRGGRPDPKIILTVSPVPLTATASGKHVLQASIYSKSVLRAVCGQLSAQHRDIDYFPSYEIITNPASRGRFFQDDLLQVTPEGVAAVMGVFARSYGLGACTGPEAVPQQAAFAERIDDAAATRCEDVILAAFAP